MVIPDTQVARCGQDGRLLFNEVLAQELAGAAHAGCPAAELSFVKCYVHTYADLSWTADRDAIQQGLG